MMKRPGPGFFISISSRLLILCLLITLVFMVNIAIMISASSNIEKVTNTIVSHDVDNILRNSQISRDLSGLLAETHFFISTFYGRPEMLEKERASLQSSIESILKSETGDELKTSLLDFRDGLERLLQQCSIVNSRYARIVEIDETINVLLNKLEETVAAKIVNLVLAGDDSRSLEQIGALIPSYRETLLQTSLNFTRMSPTLETEKDVGRIIDLLDNLHLRLRTLLASDNEVAAYGQKLLTEIEAYRQGVGTLQLESRELVKRLLALEQVEQQSIVAMKGLEDKSGNAAQGMKQEISRITDSSVKVMITLSGTVALLLGVFTYLFLLWHIRRPMELIHQGIVSLSEGDLNTRIRLGRHDEWNVIETALNRMTGDLADSYNEMQKANEKLQTMYNEIELNVQALEAEIRLREEAEEALQLSEEQYRRFFQDDLSAAFIAGNDGRILLCNPAFIRMFGFPDMEVPLNLTMRDIFPDSEKYDEFYSRLKTEERLEYYESEYVRYDGTPLYAIGNITASINDQHEIIELKGYLIDETKKKSAERKSRQLEQQLQHSKKMEALGTLAGGVAHDLNNILSGVVSYPDIMLLEMPEDSPYRQPLSIIQESGKRAAAIVQDLLTLARRGVAVSNVVSLNTIVFDYLDSADFKKMKSHHPGLDIEVDLAPDLGNIEGSPIHLMKTIMNLMSNGAESIQNKGILSIRTENRTINRSVREKNEVEPGEYSVLIIADTGEGIPAESLERIFEPFYTKKEMGRSGTGLGLAVVWGTLQDHNGFIDVHTQEGEGTIFTLYFPQTDRELPEKPEPLSLENYMGEGQSVLLIDDDATQRKIATEMVRKLGYTVTAVASGEEAVEYLKTHSADVLVLDMIMNPGIDGLETYLRIMSYKPDQKAIITSGYSETDRVREAQEAGAVRYLRKPYTLEEIGMAIKNELES